MNIKHISTIHVCYNGYIQQWHMMYSLWQYINRSIHMAWASNYNKVYLLKRGI